MKIAAMTPEKARRDFVSDRRDAFKDGMEKGMDKGREEGRVEIAKNLLKLGIDMDLIAKSTELSLTEIKALKK
ncbi:MAG: hypothetical protein LBG23_01630 [Endomicrobium sp.]|jgi:predicted transposase/invertase (TIGR01784 family)|nr:hypothetical protein [Endomicrobium sp.]